MSAPVSSDAALLPDDEIDDIIMRSEAISIAKNATLLPGLDALKAAIIAEGERHPPVLLCEHCGVRRHVGAWLARPPWVAAEGPNPDVLCLCNPCAAAIDAEGGLV